MSTTSSSYSRTAMPGSADELRVAPTVATTALLFSGVMFGLAVQLLRRPEDELVFALLLQALAAVGWALNRWLPQAGRWFLAGASVVAVLLIHGWLHMPGALALVTIPVALAAALNGLAAAAVAAAAESTLLLLLPVAAAGAGQRGELVLALAAIWGMFGLMVAVYRPAYLLSRWSWEHFERAQCLLEQARDRQAELRQALEDLAAANLQLTRLNHLAQGLRRAAEEAKRAKEQFVANVSHELRTPLNMIVGFTEMIMEAPASYGAIPQALLADLAVIQRNSKHLASLIDDVLELSQIESGGIALVKEHVRLSEIIQAAVIAVRPLFEPKGLHLSSEVPESLTLFCDRTRIREVLLNLLINAGRFTEQGGVSVRARLEGSSVVVSVADTGPGIATEDQARLFQPFQQLDGSTRRRYGGTGLGLSISRSFVELHGGTMWVQSERGQGATFFFRLPREAAPPLESGAVRWLSPSWEHVQRTHRPQVSAPLRRRLVVLEKGESLQRLLSRHLRGAELVPVTSMEQAAQEMRHTPAQALLVNRASVANALREVIEAAQLPQGTPALVCSVPGASEAADALGASDYLVKPISRDVLLDALDRLCPQAKTVLVADDEPEAQRLFRRMLISSGRGYRVLRAADGQHALNILRAQSPDAVLLDLVMPGMDGFQLLDAMRADPVLRHTPTLIISARDPAGQPIVSSALAVTRSGGLSMPELLQGIESLTAILSPMTQADDRGPR